MKICIITPIFPPEIGGPATYSYELARRLRDNHSVRIVTRTDSPDHLGGVDIFRIPFGIFEPIRRNFPYRVLRFLNGWKNLFLYLVRNRKHYDLLYFLATDKLGLAALLYALVLRKPAVLKFVGDDVWEAAFRRGKTSQLLDAFLKSPPDDPWVKAWLKVERFILNRASAIITPSYYLKDLLVEGHGVNPDKITVIPNATDVMDHERDGIELNYGKPLLCTIGRFVPWKGIGGIIEIMPSILARYPQAALLIIGEGPQREKYGALVKKMGLEKRVFFLGKRGHRETMGILKSCDLFVLNSGYEGLPHTVIEAMSCKVPVVATRIGGTRDVIQDGVTGWSVELENRDDLLDKVIHVLENEEIRREVTERAYEMVRNQFSWEKTVPKLEAVLGEMI
ncbi:glycosyltransferase family 4 protein [Chloroflexota bacterium]